MRSYSKIGDRNQNSGNIPRRGLVLTVRARPAHPSQGLLVAGNRVVRCALGRSGITANKREGDGATPRASMKVLGGYRRGHRINAPTRLALRAIRADLGWCDAPADANYNRPVRLPFPWRIGLLSLSYYRLIVQINSN